MSGELIAVIITGATTIVGNYMVYLKRARVDLKAQGEREQYVDDRLSSIEKKLDEHNGYAKKFEECREGISEVKTQIQLIQKDIKYIRSEKCDV